MEKIVQLSEYEYKKLYDAANLNSEEIKQNALDLYEAKGTFQVQLIIDTDYNYDTLSFNTRAFQKSEYGDNKYKVSFSDSKRFVDYIQENAQQIIVRKYGQQINDAKLFKNNLEHNERIQKTYKYITIGGWFFTFILTLLLIFLK